MDKKVCPICGSTDIGFKQIGKRHMHYCKNCNFFPKSKKHQFVEIPDDTIDKQEDILEHSPIEIIDEHPLAALGILIYVGIAIKLNLLNP